MKLGCVCFRSPWIERVGPTNHVAESVSKIASVVFG